jgi:hypothetical protein
MLLGFILLMTSSNAMQSKAILEISSCFAIYCLPPYRFIN